MSALWSTYGRFRHSLGCNSLDDRILGLAECFIRLNRI
jgi:hypothetical protein